jgi:hypothetical protein
MMLKPRRYIGSAQTRWNRRHLLFNARHRCRPHRDDAAVGFNFVAEVGLAESRSPDCGDQALQRETVL